MYPVIILDEFQDTNPDQWHVVKALGHFSILIALADPEQRIFDFIGADPERLNQFRAVFKPAEFDLGNENHRSKGTDIIDFGNDLLKGKFREGVYTGIDCHLFESNPNQAFTMLVIQTLKARKRLLETGKKNWTLAILVPTKRMTRQISDIFRASFGKLPAVAHSAAVDMEAAILAAEIIAFLMQPDTGGSHFSKFVELLCAFFQGKGGDAPSQTSLNEAKRIRAAFDSFIVLTKAGKAPRQNSILVAILAAHEQVKALELTGDPDKDWLAVRMVLERGNCPRLREIAHEVKNVRLLERGTQLRQALSQNWRDNGAYLTALAIIQQSFIHEHFATAHKPENGVVVMNMHKAKGKQFDEVIIFEGWPNRVNHEIVSNADRIIRSNSRAEGLSQARQNFRVSVTRARVRTTILTPRDDPCVLLIPE